MSELGIILAILAIPFAINARTRRTDSDQEFAGVMLTLILMAAAAICGAAGATK